MRYRTLDPKLIVETAERLEERIADRFPEAGLRGVAAELVSLSRDLAKAAKVLEAPIWWLRGLIVAAFVTGVLVFLFVGTILPIDRISGTHDALQSVQGIEASINTVILAVLGLLALIRTEERIKRKRVFRQLHGLRSLIHVIDMHQLTKDPAALSADFKPTAHSPARITNAADLARYLDYCSEMLSITGKIAALFAQSVNDDVVIDGVNDIENLASNLSRKIWQKITLIDGRPVQQPAPAPGPAAPSWTITVPSLAR
ncbi:MAG: hypothetical protein E5Y29_16825 [Mesorhizobium sp.]|nr:MAG: hypothetical protein E5Y29_16825 [Mesorhizobium sp.]